MKTTEETEAAIWRRAIDPENAAWSAGVAESVLNFKLPETDVDRMNELAARARDGTLSDQEQEEAEAYDRVGLIIELMQSKARRSLKQNG